VKVFFEINILISHHSDFFPLKYVLGHEMWSKNVLLINESIVVGSRWC